MTDLSKAEEKESGVVEYLPDDPEYYLQSDKEVPSAVVYRLILLLTARVMRGVVVKLLESPLNRVFLLQCVQGELVRDGRLPYGGFGGIRGSVQYIVSKEGFLGLFRGAVADTFLSFPAFLSGQLVTMGVLAAQERLVSISWSGAVVLGVASPLLRVIATAPLVSYKDVMYGNYAADIMAPTGAASPGWHTEEREETYLYNSPIEAIGAVRKKCGMFGLFYKRIDVDLAAAYAMVGCTWLVNAQVMPTLLRGINMFVKHPKKRVVALAASLVGVSALCGCVTQPFYVMRSRMILLPNVNSTNNTNTNSSLRQQRYRYRNMYRCAREIVRQDGITALWAGLRWRIVRDTGGVILNIFLRSRSRS